MPRSAWANQAELSLACRVPVVQGASYNHTMTFHKHTFVVTVLTDDNPDYDPESLEALGYDISEGEYIGDFRKVSTVEVTKAELHQELVALGNDGTFFDYDDNHDTLHDEDE